MEHTSSTSLPSGNDPNLLPAVHGWNWGAFCLSWIWAFAHGIWVWGVLALVLPFPVAIYLGMSGNELAWRTRRFQGLQQFRTTQRIWARWGIVVLVISGVLALPFFFAVLMPLLLRIPTVAHVTRLGGGTLRTEAAGQAGTIKTLVVKIKGKTYWEARSGGVYLGDSSELASILSPELLTGSRGLTAAKTTGIAATITALDPMSFRAVAGDQGMHVYVDLTQRPLWYSFGQGIRVDLLNYHREVVFAPGELQIARVANGRQIGVDMYAFTQGARIVPATMRGRLVYIGIAHSFLRP
jgi:hypothetical protein